MSTTSDWTQFVKSVMFKANYFELVEKEFNACKGEPKWFVKHGDIFHPVGGVGGVEAFISKVSITAFALKKCGTSDPVEKSIVTTGLFYTQNIMSKREKASLWKSS